MGKSAEIVHQTWTNGRSLPADSASMVFHEDGCIREMPLTVIEGFMDKSDTVLPLQYDYSIVEICDEK